MSYDKQMNAKKNKLMTIFGLKDAELTWFTDSENVQEFECNKCFVTKNKIHKCLLTVCRRSESHVEAWTECELYEKQKVSSTICTKLLRCLWEYTSEINPYAKVWKSTEYEAFFEEINERVVYILKESIYLFKSDDEEWVEKSEHQLKTAYKYQGIFDNKYLIDAYFNDPDKRVYERRAYSPHEVPDNVFNTYVQPRWKSWNLEEEASKCPEELWTKLIDLFESFFTNSEELEWFKSFIGHSIFKPSEVIDVACVLYDPLGGSGKSLIAKLLAHILGDTNVSTIKSPENELFNQFSESYTKSTLLVIEELKGLIGHKHESDFKNLIGSSELTYRIKGVQGDFKCENRLHIWCNTNEKSAINLGEGNTRRWVIFQVDRDKSYGPSNKTRWASLSEHRTWFSALYSAICPYDRISVNIPLASKFVLWLKESQWDSFMLLNAPITEIMTNLKKRSMPLECEFLVNECENMVEFGSLTKRLKFSEWYEEFKKFSGNMRTIQKSSIVKSNFRMIDISGIKHSTVSHIDYMTIENAETVLEELAKRY